MLYKNITAFLQIKFTGLWRTVLEEFFFPPRKHQVLSVTTLNSFFLIIRMTTFRFWTGFFLKMIRMLSYRLTTKTNVI